MTDSIGLTDEEFRAKLENHFAMYRMNLRSPLVQQVSIDEWYRAEVFLVNEIGLFKRADIEPDGRVDLGCELLVPASADSLTPLKQDTTCDLTVRPSTWPGADEPHYRTLEWLVSWLAEKDLLNTRLHRNTITDRTTNHVEKFPQQQQQQQTHSSQLDDWILPLVVGPIELLDDAPGANLNGGATNASIERWPTTTAMVHSSYRLFSTVGDLVGNDTNNVAIHESWESGIPGKIWDSALVMLQMLERMVQYKPDYLTGKHVLDLSAGTGLIGLSVAKDAQPSMVTITELGEATDLIKSNVSLNSYLTSKCPVVVQDLFWGDEKQASICGKADLILASDVLYESEFFEDLVKSFIQLCNNNDSGTPGKIYIGYKRRGFDLEEETRFWTLCRQHHFDITLLNDHPSDEDACLVPPLATKSGVQLYRLTPSI
ncbi:unnamed protein product [Absidia cylindrospora]